MSYYTDIVPKTNEEDVVGYKLIHDIDAVKNSLINLFTIRKGEVPGKPWLGSPLTPYLFDNIGFFEEKAIQTAFKNTVALYEPRVDIQSLRVVASPEYNRITVTIKFYVLINNTKTFENLRFSLAHNEMTSIVTRHA